MEEKDYTAPAIVFAVILIMVVIKTVDPDFRISDLIAALATLIAAFVGARAAFSMQIKKQNNDEIKKQRVAVNQTLYLIAEMWKNLRGYNNQAIAYAINTPAPWLSMKFRFSNIDVKLPHEELLFLLDTAHANLYLELLHMEQTYNITCDALQILFKAQTEELQPKLEKLGYPLHGVIDVGTLEIQLGPVLVSKLKEMTDDAIADVPKDMQSLRALYNKFRVAMAEHFKGHLVREFEFYD